MAYKTQECAQAQSKLMRLPLELRHKIYEYINCRDRWEERQVLRDYLNHIHPQLNNGDDIDQRFDDEERFGDSTSVVDDAGEVEGNQEEEDDDELETNDEDLQQDDIDGANDDDDTDSDESDVIDQDPSGLVDLNAEQVAAATATASTTPHTAHRPRNKYRHVPYLMHLSSCPPPTNALLVCQRVRNEAISHFYDTNILYLEATKSFRHLNFFEETLQEIASAPFSPLESIRKVDLRIVWDSAYVNTLDRRVDSSDMDYDRLQGMRSMLETYLNLRLEAVYEALEKSTQLMQLTVRIYNSKSSGQEVVLRDDIIERLIMMSCQKDLTMNVVEHNLEETQRPKRTSVVGAFRAELREIVEQRFEIR